VIALIRGLVRHNATTLGNAWVDLTRSTVYLLLPLSVLWALLFISQGVIQNFSAYVDVTTLEGAKQTLAMGPVASQEAIKLLGTNGGGFFNANSAHPFENPTAFANFLQMLAIFIIPAALCFAFGKMVKDMRQGWTVYAAMAILFVVFAITAIYAEQQANPVLTALGMESSSGNMEGKEVRFGIADSALFTAVTTGASCGAVNNMHDSLTPLGGAVPTVLMQLGEVVFGGVGSGLYGMLIFAILAVFISGLMIGRTPEYLGKKIENLKCRWCLSSFLSHQCWYCLARL
jgi:K+-transporting ATPase ATPase A chain